MKILRPGCHRGPHEGWVCGELVAQVADVVRKELARIPAPKATHSLTHEATKGVLLARAGWTPMKPLDAPGATGRDSDRFSLASLPWRRQGPADQATPSACASATAAVCSFGGYLYLKKYVLVLALNTGLPHAFAL